MAERTEQLATRSSPPTSAPPAGAALQPLGALQQVPGNRAESQLVALQLAAGNGAVSQLVALQQVAGNRAVSQLVARSRAVQRNKDEFTSWGDDEDAPNSSPIDPDLREPEPEDMSWTGLQEGIDEQRSFLSEQTSTSPEVLRAEARLASLEAAQKKLAGRATTARPAKGKRKGKTKPPLPTRPESLEHSIDLTQKSPQEVKAELDLVVAYLAAGPPKGERKVLELEMPYLEEAAGVARAEKQATRRQEKLSAALSPTTGNEADQLTEMLHRLQDAQRDPSQEGIWLIHHDGLVFPLEASELVALRQRAAGGLLEGASAVNNLIGDVELAWRERHRKNRDQNIVHGLVKFATGAEDISPKEIADMVEVGDFFVGRVRDRGRAGALVLAGDDLLILDRFARYKAEKVGEWESELVSGAGRWVIALTILKESLSIMAGFGAAKLATAAGGGFFSTLKTGATIAGLTTGVGAVAGGVGAAVTGRDVVKGVRAGGGAGFGVGANALTAGVGKIASVADAAKASTFAGKAYAVGKAVALEAGASVTTSVTQAAIEGGDMGNAALGALASSPISTLGGGVVEKFAKGKAAATVGKVVVGATAGTAGAAASDGSLVAGALVGGGGGLYSGLASPAMGAAPAPAPEAAPTASAAPAPAPEAAPTASVAPAPAAGAGPTAAAEPTLAAAPAMAPSPTPAPPTAAAAPAPPAAGAGERLFAPEDIESHLANLEGDVAGHNPEGANVYSVHPDALNDARFSREGGSELDVRNISKVTIRDGPVPLPDDPKAPRRQAELPPETWLLDPQRANLSDPTAIADTPFLPNRTGRDFDVRNAQVVAGTTGDRVVTPAGPTFGDDRVVGGARGATLDPATGTWRPGGAPYERPYNPLGQDAAFAPRTPDEWHAWEQTHGPMTDEQRYALWFYSDDLSGHLNPALRGQGAQKFVTDPAARAAAASDLDQAMQPVPFDTVVLRKTSIGHFRDLGVRDPSELVNMKGRSYAHEGYTSTGVVPGTWSGAIDIVIQVPKGTRGRYLGGAPGAQRTNPVKPTPGAPLASMPGEMEFLIERGTSFTIQDARQDTATGRWTIEVRVAEQGVRSAPLNNPVPLPGTPAKP